MTIDEFYQEYCIPCGSQRCEGPGTIWGLGCPRYCKEILGYPCSDCDLWSICEVSDFCQPYQKYRNNKEAEELAINEADQSTYYKKSMQ